MGYPDDPIDWFGSWLDDAVAHPDLPEPTGMALATADAAGRPSVRFVLLKDYGLDGFVFYTNLASRKAVEIRENPHASMAFWWKPLNRQVRIDGPVELVSDEVADAYFASRDRKSRIGAWASKQSQALTEPLELERRVARFGARFAVGAIPRPDFWSGYRLIPEAIEFWEDRAFRLHERHLFRRVGDAWEREQLYP